jgi:prepilin-type N-terminal cleavage/methylation domain-containing protein
MNNNIFVFRQIDCASIKKKKSEEGFSLVEVVIAMMVFLVALLGVFATFTYAINYNAGNNSRAQALAILQQEVELMRSAKFTPAITDPSLTGGTKAARAPTFPPASGGSYIVEIKVDNDPSTAAIDSPGDTTTTLKEVTVTVKLDSPTPGWQTSVPATVILRRVRAN